MLQNLRVSWIEENIQSVFDDNFLKFGASQIRQILVGQNFLKPLVL